VEQKGAYIWDIERKACLGSELKFSFFQTDDLPLYCPTNVPSWNQYRVENFQRNSSKDSLDLHLAVCYINSMIYFDSSGLNDIVSTLWEKEVGLSWN